MLQLLKDRFVAIPTELEERIRQLNAESLQLLIRNSFDFTNLADVERYLQAK
ncbi:DUF4351 domain-containing protein [Metasolibacillus sp.]|uniref:DUF4351 domain-containing protein n=1 Tax=Metasolibacillus sp. TaxID=2703680 RepID=UPI0025EED5B2|nr:DUF4351 domain-containing protein [Metasolibacillus sp.]MCT6923395.1 DUF4351 domain-containing protein [Metasolibacillus sp.]MCT6939882.1 DUF4351 domain-containing protein [Metasolibacillus sp.]